MTLPRTVADVLTDHVVFEIESHRPDVPATCTCLGCSTPPALVQYIHRQMGLPVASTVVAGAGHQGVRRRRCTRFARDHQIPWVDFAKGQRKDDIAQEYLAAFEAVGGTEGVSFVGRLGEHARVSG